MNGGKVERCSRIKDRNGRLALGEDKLQRILKSKFHSTCVASMFRGISEVGVRKIKNGKAAGKDEVTGEMIKSGGDAVVDWIWRLCNIDFESGVIVPLYKGKEEKT